MPSQNDFWKTRKRLLLISIVGITLIVFVGQHYQAKQQGRSVLGGCNTDGWAVNSASNANGPLTYGSGSNFATQEFNLCPGDRVLFITHHVPELKIHRRAGEPEAKIQISGELCRGSSVDTSLYDGRLCVTHNIGHIQFGLFIFDNFEKRQKWPGGVRIDVTTRRRGT